MRSTMMDSIPPPKGVRPSPQPGAHSDLDCEQSMSSKDRKQRLLLAGVAVAAVATLMSVLILAGLRP